LSKISIQQQRLPNPHLLLDLFAAITFIVVAVCLGIVALILSQG